MQKMAKPYFMWDLAFFVIQESFFDEIVRYAINAPISPPIVSMSTSSAAGERSATKPW